MDNPIQSDSEETKPGPVQRALRIMRSAPSTSSGIKLITQKLVGRLTGWPDNKSIRRAKTEFWETQNNFESFVTNTDRNKSPIAAYMDAVINQFFLDHCPPDARVLDIGCGHGIVSIFLARHARRVTAFDASDRMLQELLRNSEGLNIKVQQGDAYRLPFEDDAFDAVVARMFLYHFSDWPRILREMARCCRRGGRLVVHFTCKENDEMAESSGLKSCDFNETNRLRDMRGRDGAAFTGVFNRRTIKRACRRSGLRLVETAPCTFLHYNRLIGRSLGTEKFADYKKELGERLKDPKVLDFIVWLEQTVIRHMPFWFSHYNLLVLEKL
jgi:SAM-dependent methyltransferase